MDKGPLYSRIQDDAFWDKVCERLGIQHKTLRDTARWVCLGLSVSQIGVKTETNVKTIYGQRSALFSILGVWHVEPFLFRMYEIVFEVWLEETGVHKFDGINLDE